MLLMVADAVTGVALLKFCLGKGAMAVAVAVGCGLIAVAVAGCTGANAMAFDCWLRLLGIETRSLLWLLIDMLGVVDVVAAGCVC